ncbi:hypothetical protein HBI56_121510 [Parastagonospora nodorum]|nr:hypothetical protein HBI80_125040 [Parastagonospora nodorum]KAH5159818.1 hypothetical protein HBH69_056760 [Parastagonospora nodorum]KAH5202732.1 hypothetical protein HBH77_116660 [Parastagonospora nodorum]KAH5329829.1 hypothetical protein HBI12_068750 [Parastagonospora nodorum]KAH5457709.1 hypothetical protein HBI30_066430 [Parastagonospora nodorum]
MGEVDAGEAWGVTVCFRDFNVTQKTRRLLSSPHVEPSLPLVKDSAVTVLNVSPWNGAHGRAVSAAWTTELNNDLLYLATIIKQSRKLRILRIQATSELHPLLRLLERRDYLFLSTIRAFLSASNLTTLAAHATCCGSSPGGFLQLKADMEKQEQVLVAQMAAPKIVRILTHALPSIEVRAFDVLTGRNVTLIEGAEWDDDGEANEDEVSDEESKISDLSSDDDG